MDDWGRLLWVTNKVLTLIDDSNKTYNIQIESHASLKKKKNILVLSEVCTNFIRNQATVIVNIVNVLG